MHEELHKFDGQTIRVKVTFAGYFPHTIVDGVSRKQFALLKDIYRVATGDKLADTVYVECGDMLDDDAFDGPFVDLDLHDGDVIEFDAAVVSEEFEQERPRFEFVTDYSLGLPKNVVVVAKAPMIVR